MKIALDVCAELGVPVANDKVDGPATRFDVLGIEIDTVAVEIRLQRRKLIKLVELVRSWKSRKSGRKQEVCHACRVVRPGHRFLRGMFAALSCAKRSSHFVRLNARFRADLEWWHSFTKEWNRVSMTIPRNESIIEIWSDASDSWGCTAYSGKRWFQVERSSAIC